MNKSLVSGFLGLLAIFLASPALAATQGFTVEGRVVSSDGNPAGDALVTVSVSATGCSIDFTSPPTNVSSDGSFEVQIDSSVTDRPRFELCQLSISGNAQLQSKNGSGSTSGPAQTVEPGEVFALGDVVIGVATTEYGTFAIDETPEAPSVSVADSQADSNWTGAGRGIFGVILVAVVFLGVPALLIWVCVLVARAAMKKGRNFWPWFWISFFFLVPAAIIVAIMQPKQELVAPVIIQASTTPEPPSGDTKSCPYCGESILAVAVKCKHCGEFLER